MSVHISCFTHQVIADRFLTRKRHKLGPPRAIPCGTAAVRRDQVERFLRAPMLQYHVTLR
jgi:hypothetical protein